LAFSARAVPQFRSALLDAEAYLNGFLTGAIRQAWRALHDAAGDGDAVFDMLGALLAAQRPRLEMSQARGEWCSSQSARYPARLRRPLAIAALLDPDGGRRFKRCRVEGCVNVFLDWTNGISRTGCRLHPRRSVPVAD
jgi:predicted RNA-binding Zn ribbon-like protein